uniref:Secreted protein n=1 Tax=Steinernema glaseri TaxID=37863 RepID=A0A1I7ZKL8_9BILA
MRLSAVVFLLVLVVAAVFSQDPNAPPADANGPPNQGLNPARKWVTTEDGPDGGPNPNPADPGSDPAAAQNPTP